MTSQLLFNPSSGPLRYACAVSGSGSNYEKIYEKGPGLPHIVFSNTPGCAGMEKARDRGVPVVSLDSTRYFYDMWGLQKVPRNGVERDSYHMALMTLVEQTLGGRPDLVCLAGYDLWLAGWMVDRYYPRILNVHPGDAPKYTGLGWRPTAKAILAGEASVKSTVFLVDRSDDGGPILIQSASLPLSRWDKELRDVRQFADRMDARDLGQFNEAARREGNNLYKALEEVSTRIQESLKVEGDWQIYPFAVHNLIARGRVEIEGRTIYVDGIALSEKGWQVDEYGFADSIR
jgi:phosphoribosylglycinamide formyltransferase 1